MAPSSRRRIGAVNLWLLVAVIAVIAIGVFIWARRRPTIVLTHLWTPSTQAKSFLDARFTAAVDTTPDILAFNDVQKLPGNGADDFGPLATLYVSPVLGTITELQFEKDTGAFVGLVEVAAGNVPQTYKLLKLDDSPAAAAMYCLYLKHDVTVPAHKFWQGFVTKAAATPGTCVTPVPTDPHIRLDANADLANDPTNGGSPTFADSFPAVARFTEDNAGNPAFGMKCGQAWCEMGRAVSQPPSDKGTGQARKRIKGWNDEQYVALPNGSGVKHGVLLGKVTPAGNLVDLAFPEDVWVTVGSVWLSQNPPAGSRYDTWHLVNGDNPIQLKIKNGHWWAKMGTSADEFIVNRGGNHPHKFPGIARWLWSDTDEEIWIACDQGCCEITGLK